MYYFIINPKSRSDLGAKIWNQVEQELQKRRIVYQAFLTKYRGHAKKLARVLSGTLTPDDILAAIGGDGTINEIVSGLTHPEQVIFGYIPTGSGNDFARGMGLAKDVSTALQAILKPRVIRTIDIGVCQASGKERRFVISSGIGFDAGICHEALASPIKDFLNRFGLGKLTYASIALRHLLFFKRFDLKLSMDGDRSVSFYNVWFLAAMNLKYEGGGFKFCPSADSADGCLDLMVVSDISRLKVLLMLPAAFFGKHIHLKGVRFLRCRNAHISTSIKRPVHLDGESGGSLDSLDISCIRRQLNVIIK
ncbi:diacylglycerol kinase family lipid kinase [Lawsonibacter sp. OA9]|uniref:diacylglycerol/lipid kinase family protein n=1 Tax=Oscillospiraceae TaxID=216572 RepID=UPI001F056E8E|nr:MULTISPECIES: diacylglycerol kinase family protein [Oscillospiraceae]MCH1978214.1 diacylglycerol kinase family lipid kinase [Lawsonibacter sp. OA9]MCH1982652.1 diacylglycerol kinase family lipid kinase [Ruminococcus sp. OA3]